MTFMKSLMGGFGWACVAAVLLWLGLFIATGEQFIVVRWISYVLPWLAGLLLITALAAFLLHRRWQGGIAALLALLLLLPYAPRFIPSVSGQAEAGQRQIYKVMTYSKMGRNVDIDAIARVVMAEQPDILFMQEIGGTEAEQLINKISAQYHSKISFFVDNNTGLIISRFKVVSRWKMGDGVVHVEIKLPDGVINAWNVHLQKSLATTGIQYKAIDHLAAAVQHTDGPVLVAGDFNATTINYPCVKMNQYLDDAFEQAGFGFGFTFPSPARRMGMITPFMRIDHIYFSHHFIVHKAYVVDDAGGSDHYPVVALMSFTDTPVATVP